MSSLLTKLNSNFKVDFVIAGTQKGGTTALDNYLRSHDQVLMATEKEVHFFDTESNFKNVTDYSKYHSYFNKDSPEKLVGESTPIYMYWKQAPERLWTYNPHLKIIISLRNPIDRAYSHWNMERDRGYDNLSFWEAITTEKSRIKQALPYQHRIYSYIDRGFYTQQLKRIWRFFPKEQTLIIKCQDLKASPQATLSSVSRFLDIVDFRNIKHEIIHSRPYVSSMSKSEHEFLHNIFYDEIKSLEQLLGWDCSDWLDLDSNTI